jgi:hypothetical protein
MEDPDFIQGTGLRRLLGRDKPFSHAENGTDISKQNTPSSVWPGNFLNYPKFSKNSLPKTNKKSHIWWCIPIIPALGRLRQKEHELELA